MSGTLTITPMQRYADLRRTFKGMVPSRRRRLSSIQMHHIAMAASKQQVAETAILERALGKGHDREFIERLKVEVKQHLDRAGAKFHQQERP